ncbi:hypothetical protein GCM10027034_38600 [Ramlibacter solisilvae]
MEWLATILQEAKMARTFSLALLFALAGCAGGTEFRVDYQSPCAGNEASYQCQIYRYQNAH